MLFPITKEYEQMRLEQDNKVEQDGVEGVEDVIYFKQTSSFSPSLSHLASRIIPEPTPLITNLVAF
jgi:hypothetical protein